MDDNQPLSGKLDRTATPSNSVSSEERSEASEFPSTEELIAALRELWVTDSDLSYLGELPPGVLARIHGEVTAHAKRVHEGQRRLYEVMARTTRFIPNMLVARMSGSLSPYVLAQVAEHMEPKSAAALTKAFDQELLGQILLHIDTRAAAAIAVHTDLDTLVQMTEILQRNGFVKRLGEVSDALEEHVLEKVVQRMRDPHRIAAVAAHMRAHHKLRTVAQKLDAKVRAAVVAILESQGHAQAVRAILARGAG